MSAVMKVIGMLAFLACSVLGCRPMFRIYEQSGYGGDYQENSFEFVALGDEYDISLKGITTTRYRTCPLGLWMGYSETRFGGYTQFYSEKDGTVNKCSLNTGLDVAQSLKVVGHPTDYTARAVVTYMRSVNEWQDLTYLNDTSQLESSVVGSIIITGNEEVEIFTEPDFQGESWCIGPNNGRLYDHFDWDAKNHLRNGTELFTNIQRTEPIMGTESFNSFRFGCGETRHRAM